MEVGHLEGNIQRGLFIAEVFAEKYVEKKEGRPFLKLAQKLCQLESRKKKEPRLLEGVRKTTHSTGEKG